MDEKKKQRKSKRSFNMEKYVERHFEIEKEQVPIVSSKPAPDGIPASVTSGDTDQQNGGKKSLVAVIVLVVLAILAFFIYKGCGSGTSETDSSPVVELSDSTSNEPSDSISDKSAPNQSTDTSTSSSNTSDDTQAVGNVSEQTVPATQSSSEKSVEEKAKDVWDGVYGNGAERKDKLGSDYKAVQKRVNEMYRNGYRH